MTWHTVVDPSADPGDGGQRFRRIGVACAGPAGIAVAWPGGHSLQRPEGAAPAPAPGESLRAKTLAAAIDPIARAPMAARILTVHVSLGDVVARGTPMVVMEAMKMEHRVCAPGPGVVAALHTAAGAQVAQGDMLVELTLTQEAQEEASDDES